MIVKKIDSIEKAFHQVISKICIVAIFIMTCIVFYSVIMRYIFKSAPFWGEEISRYILVWVSLLGASLAFSNREHAAVEYFTNKMSEKTQKMVTRFTDILSLIFFAYVIKYGIISAISGFRMVSPATGIKMFYPFLGIPIGCLACFIQILFNLIHSFKNE